MNTGIPLSDADRWDWLISLREAATKALLPSPDNNYQPPNGVVVSCSALKRKYRDVIRVAAYGTPYIRIHFIYLRLDEKSLMERLQNRRGHYMKSDMLESQLQILETPDSAEWDVDTIDVGTSLKEVLRKVEGIISGKLADS